MPAPGVVHEVCLLGPSPWLAPQTIRELVFLPHLFPSYVVLSPGKPLPGDEPDNMFFSSRALSHTVLPVFQDLLQGHTIYTAILWIKPLAPHRQGLLL